jgi:NAD(P) transhydrogenase subunit alpha
MTRRRSWPAAPAGQFCSFTVFVWRCSLLLLVWSVTRPCIRTDERHQRHLLVIIVGGLIAAGPAGISVSKVMGFIAVTLASINIFGGFIVTQRMLAMFKKKVKK